MLDQIRAQLKMFEHAGHQELEVERDKRHRPLCGLRLIELADLVGLLKNHYLLRSAKQCRTC